MNVAIICFDGVDELDVIGPFRVFAGADSPETPVAVSLVTIEPRDAITTSHGLTINIEDTINAVNPDIVVIPGGGWNAKGETSAWAEAERGALPEVIRDLATEGCIIAGVCTGSMLMERAGILDGRRAITHAGAVDELRESEAIVVPDRIVDDGNIVTAGGVTSGIDLALHLIARELGDDVANAVADNIEYQRQDSILS